jgi:hypothetical protein
MMTTGIKIAETDMLQHGLLPIGFDPRHQGRLVVLDFTPSRDRAAPQLQEDTLRWFYDTRVVVWNGTSDTDGNSRTGKESIAAAAAHRMQNEMVSRYLP